MGIKERLRHVAAGIADSFICRNNDLAGYWAPGLMYREAEAQPHTILLDLMSELAEPAAPHCLQVARKYAAYMRVAAAKKMFPHEIITQGLILVHFDVQCPVRQRVDGTGALSEINVILQADGEEGRANRLIGCHPFVEGAFSRRSNSNQEPIILPENL